MPSLKTKKRRARADLLPGSPCSGRRCRRRARTTPAASPSPHRTRRSAATRSAILFAQASARSLHHGGAVDLFVRASGSRLMPSPNGPPPAPHAIPASGRWRRRSPALGSHVPVPARAAPALGRRRLAPGRRRRALACPVAGSGRPRAGPPPPHAETLPRAGPAPSSSRRRRRPLASTVMAVAGDWVEGKTGQAS
jgi:hypothetical protein